MSNLNQDPYQTIFHAGHGQTDMYVWDEINHINLVLSGYNTESINLTVDEARKLRDALDDWLGDA